MKNIRKLMITGTALGMLVASITAGKNILFNLSRGRIIPHAATNETLVNETYITNNINYGNTNGDDSPGNWAESRVGSGFICNNLYYAESGGAWVSYSVSGSITNSDPESLKATNDAHLRKCSPAVESGFTLSAVTNDYGGLLRPDTGGSKRRL